VLRLIKLGFYGLCLAGFVWFGRTVPLGERTLFEHVRAIGETEASQKLFDGTRDTVEQVREDVGRTLFRAAENQMAGSKGLASGEPADELTPADRKELRELLESVRRHRAAQTTAQ